MIKITLRKKTLLDGHEGLLQYHQLEGARDQYQTVDTGYIYYGFSLKKGSNARLSFRYKLSERQPLGRGRD